jgi:predicted dehydrogenase
MEKIRVLLAGIGGYGALYLKEFLDGDHSAGGGYVFAGAADPFAERSPRFAELKERGIPVYRSPGEFYAAGGRADLAVIAAPIHTHYSYVLACFEQGSNVLCEKPVCGEPDKLEELIRREKETGLFAAVGFQLCFSRDVLALKADIMGGLFGRPLGFKALCMPRRGTKYYRRNGWAGKIRFEGETILDSPLNNACAHELQNMLFLLGEETNRSVPVEGLEAELWRGRPGIENFDAAALRVKTGPGTPLLFYTAHCVEEPMTGPQGEYRFEKALVRWGERPGSGFIAHFNDGRTKPYGEASTPMQKFYDALEAARGARPPACTLESARSHLRCTALAQGFPVTQVPEEKLIRGEAGEGDDFYAVPGLAAAFLKAYGENLLPSEAGFSV